MAVRWGHADRDVVAGTEKQDEQPRERFFDRSEFGALLAELEGRPLSPSVVTLRMVAYTGCRPKEAMQALWSDIDLVNEAWRRPALSTKTKRTHTIELPETAVDMLKFWRGVCPDNFYGCPGNKPGAPLTEYKRLWRGVTEATGIDGTVYDLRRTVVTYLISNGVDLRTVMGITGHTTPTVLLRNYAKLVPGKSKKALNELMGGGRG